MAWGGSGAGLPPYGVVGHIPLRTSVALDRVQPEDLLSLPLGRPCPQMQPRPVVPNKHLWLELRWWWCGSNDMNLTPGVFRSLCQGGSPNR